MNKFAKILSAVIAVVMALSMITLAFAANDAAVSLNLVEDKAGEVVLSVKLDKGEAIGALEVMVTAKGANIGACTAIKMNKDPFDTTASNTANGMIAVATAEGVGAGTDVATYTFAKIADEAVSVEDFDIAVKNCASAGEGLDKLECAAVNKLPEKVTEPSTEATEPSTEATEPSTEATEPSTEATEPSTEATEPSTEDKTDAPATDDKTDAPAADDKTEAPSTGDVVNPDTGDSATATAAIVSLLAVSGAALVALRKKED